MRRRARTCYFPRMIEQGIKAGVSRRTFTASASVSVAALFAPAVLGQGKAKVVVIGGGPAGCVAARHVHKDASGAIAVTLIEPQKIYTTPFFSNLYLGGFRSLASITQGYEAIRRHGIAVVHEAAATIDRDKKQVVLAGGARFPYDRLVVAPGIDLKFDSVPGYSEAAASVMPHAWTSGAQVELLAQKLNALQDGDTIVMVAPPNPYRCPPGPYERVSMFAHVLKQRGHTRSKIIVLDPKPTFAMQALFQEAWESYYPGVIEWQDPSMHGGIKGVDPASGEIETDLASYKAALANVIPTQMAGRIARDGGLADASGYCPIDPATMASTMDRSIFVIGDACIGGDMPKSASGASSQAKVAAQVILGELTRASVPPARYTTACWSLIETGDGVKVGGAYEPGEGRIKTVAAFVSQKDEAAAERTANYRESVDWYAGFVADVFG
jgi:sulfide dehydrogenase [flavocytochrome c] flavoprotein chain